jgi:hypothetical protein
MTRIDPRRVIVEECVDMAFVPPGESYQTTCRPYEPIILGTVIVRDFVLDACRVGNVSMKFHEHDSPVFGTRAYGLEHPLRHHLASAAPSMEIMLTLRNASERPLPVRQAAIEELR